LLAALVGAPKCSLMLVRTAEGAERKAALRQLIDSGRLDDIPGFLAESALSSDERQALGRIHPAFMGGEYLPDLMPDEVMVARITIASTTQDVVCVYARRTKHRTPQRHHGRRPSPSVRHGSVPPHQRRRTPHGRKSGHMSMQPSSGMRW